MYTSDHDQTVHMSTPDHCQLFTCVYQIMIELGYDQEANLYTPDHDRAIYMYVLNHGQAIHMYTSGHDQASYMYT